MLAVTLIGADGAVAAPSPGYTASFIPVGSGSAASVAVNAVTDTVYVAEIAATGYDLVAMDGSSHAIKATLHFAGALRGIAVNSVTDTVYATDGSQIAVIDGATNSVTATIPMPTGVLPAGIAVNSTTNMIYVASISITTPGVVVIDGSSNVVTTTVSSGGRTQDIAVDAATNVIWASDVGGPVVAISGATGSIIHSVSVNTPLYIAVNPLTNTVYVNSGSGANPLTVIDGATGTITTTVPITGTGNGRMAVDPSTDVVFARGDAASGAGMVVIDGATNTVADVLRSSSGVAVAVDETTGTVYETSSIAGFPGVWAITRSATNGISPLMSGPSAATGNIGDSFATSFTIAAGLPVPSVTETGRLPAGVTLNPNGLLSGTPAAGTAGVYPITVTASNGIAPDYSLPFTLTITGSVAVAALGPGGVPYAQAPQLGAGWLSLGGTVIAPPAVAAPPNANGTTTAAPLFIAPGTNHLLYIRGVTGAWQRLGPNDASCLSAGAVITSGVLRVACEGTDNALYYNSATLPSSGLPQFTTAWQDLGGTLAAGPAVAPVDGVLTFFVLGTNGKIYTRTLTSGYTAAAWSCLGQPAAALLAATGVTFFACQGTNHGLYVGTVTSTGLGAAGRQSGTLAAGPGIAAASSALVLLLVGTNHLVYQGSPGSAYASLGTLQVTGVEGAALN